MTGSFLELPRLVYIPPPPLIANLPLALKPNIFFLLLQLDRPPAFCKLFEKDQILYSIDVMESAAFVPGMHTFYDALKSQPLRTKARRDNCCAIRASIDTPETPANGDEKNPLESSRMALEKMLKADMKSSTGSEGQCECIWCHGTKERRCSWCDGKGFRHEMVQKTWEELSEDIEKMQASPEPQPMKLPEKVPVQCSACSGSKKLRCAYCRGSGIGSYGHAY